MCFATHGAGHLDEQRLHHLLEPLQPETFAFDYGRKVASALRLLDALRRRRPPLVVMEGTGIFGGAAVLVANAVFGVPFVISSGDAVGPFLGLRSRLAGTIGGLYERLLCRRCAGFIGWTPYLVGRALTFGAPRGMTAPGWAREAPSADARERLRARLEIAPETIVVGLVGSLDWTESAGYVYGLELIRAVRRLKRSNVVACIVGDGSGLQRLQELAGSDLGGKIKLLGRVAPEEVADHLAVFDLASLSQSVDKVGSFRYTTKLSEYLGAGLPIIAGQIPAAYDMDAGYFWRLPGSAPWSEIYLDGLVRLLESLTAADVAERRHAASLARDRSPFDRALQQRHVVAFVEDLMEGRRDRGRLDR
jgi:glycosyltransferase involved in cell wall biosynthesis